MTRYCPCRRSGELCWVCQDEEQERLMLHEDLVRYDRERNARPSPPKPVLEAESDGYTLIQRRRDHEAMEVWGE